MTIEFCRALVDASEWCFEQESVASSHRRHPKRSAAARPVDYTREAVIGSVPPVRKRAPKQRKTSSAVGPAPKLNMSRFWLYPDPKRKGAKYALTKDFTVKRVTKMVPTGDDGRKKMGLVMGGMFALRDVPSGTAIPYFGQITMDNKHLEKDDQDRYVLEAECSGDGGKKQRCFVNADPKFFPSEINGVRVGFRGMGIASLANEPGPSTKGANALLAVVNRSDVRKKDLALFDLFWSRKLKTFPVLVTTRDLKEGEEVFVCYGTSYARNWELHKSCNNE